MSQEQEITYVRITTCKNCGAHAGRTEYPIDLTEENIESINIQQSEIEDGIAVRYASETGYCQDCTDL